MTLVFRRAERADLSALIAIFAEDLLGGHGDTTDPEAFPRYERAFDQIEASNCDQLIVGVLDGEVVATAQVTFTTTLTSIGTTNMTIGAVQTRSDMRGQGVGGKLINHCIALGKEHGVGLIQLMSNAKRVDAHRFYEGLGFKKSHAGFKMVVEAGPAAT
ncbi:GNAT family N-acetyltransferase [Phyllobacterium sp. OV277]|uniref:GNAT family N-acetyltransferase n=1 Tax=Phyllobacterium sp. OV277 TaxID=1882772 RepID=UPI0008902CD8|nr:GNAT family N-acetyltransferase [Phyllobacterium sp. OV277]SDN80896.1 Acetyltransferase (GNAT) family protein [Phyllobacterium sp. OV277]